MPQDCGDCWRPCGALVPLGRERCARCEEALSTHPNARVRYALTREPTVRDSVLLVLSADPDPLVRTGAEFRLITGPLEGDQRA